MNAYMARTVLSLLTQNGKAQELTKGPRDNCFFRYTRAEWSRSEIWLLETSTGKRLQHDRIKRLVSENKTR